jgi:serine/threonine-protein kinase
MDDSDDDFTARCKQRVGSTLGTKYSIEKLIGVGGMAAVYRARHRNGHRVAVKMLHPELSISADVKARFLREGYVANRVDHRGAVRVIDDDVADDGAVFLVMELLDGETIEARLDRSGGTLPPDQVVRLACQVLDVLGAAHANGVVHRDIKPENLFLEREDDRVKVLDFGIARLLDGSAKATRTGRMIGTPAFMAPEQSRGESKQIDAQTDVWAVGATMLRMLSGRYVHDAETAEMMIVKSATQAPRSLRELAPHVPEALAAIVDKAVAFEKAARWPSARAMADALRASSSDRASEPGTPAAQVSRTALMSVDVAFTHSRRPVGVATTEDQTELAVPIFANVAASTTAGLSNSPALAAKAQHGLNTGRIIAAALITLVTIGAIATVFIAYRRVPEPPGLTPSPSPRAASSIAASAAPSAVAEPNAPPAVADVAVVARDAAPPARPPADASPRASAAPPRTPPPPVAAASAIPVAKTTTAACTPPWILLADGSKQYKRECLK